MTAEVATGPEATRVAIVGRYSIYQAVDRQGQPVEQFYPQHRLTQERATGADGAPIWFESVAAAEEWARGHK